MRPTLITWKQLLFSTGLRSYKIGKDRKTG